MTPARRHRRPAWVLCALAGVVCAAAAAAPAAPPVFTGKLDAPSFRQYNPAYPGGGAYYCLPTSSADGIAWLAEHGYDRLPTREAEQAIVTALAAKMQTDPLQGTQWKAAGPGLADYLDDFYDPARVGIESPEARWPDPDAFAWTQDRLARPDTVVIIMRTMYLNLPDFGWGLYVKHAMFLAGYDAPAAGVYLHDPLAGEVDDLQPVGLIENLGWRGDFEYYTFDLALTPPPQSPPGTTIEARWDKVLAISIAGDGDANCDGAVDEFDLAALANNYGRSDVGWAGADFNGDGRTDVLDLATIANHYSPPLRAGGSTELAADGQSVPEPATLVMLLAGALAVARRCRRRRP